MNNSDNKPFTVKTNWNISRGTDFESMLLTKYVADTKNADELSINIDEISSLESAMLLTNVIDADKLHPDDRKCHIKVVSNLRIAKLSFLACDCSRVEVFTGSLYEYSTTSYGELLDEFDGSKSYLFEVTFGQNVNQAMVKFISDDDELWILGMKMHIVANTPASIPTAKPKFDSNSIRQMLTNSNRPISANAEKSKDFIMQFMDTNEIAGPLGMLSMFQNSAIHATPAILTEPPHDCGNANVKGASKAESMASAGNIELIKMYFDIKLQALEQRITEKIDRRFQQVEQLHTEKFNQIIELLKK